jgi:sirohydrochlorin ferrochelatase
MPQGCRPAGAEIACRDPVGSIHDHRTVALLLGHGSRVAGANAAFEALAADFARGHPELEVAHAYIELAAPLLADALAALAARAERVIVLPLFLLTAGHLKDDLPAALAAARVAFPKVRFEAARALGATNELVELGLARLGAPAPQAARTALLGVGRGSSDADANGDFCKLVRMVGERGGFARAVPCFIAVTEPRSPAALDELARIHAGPIAVWPFFLFDGLLAQQLAREVAELRARHPDRSMTLAAPLAPHPLLLALLDRRLREVLAGEVSLACDGCARAVA